jgi:hypothetical protein
VSIISTLKSIYMYTSVSTFKSIYMYTSIYLSVYI